MQNCCVSFRKIRKEFYYDVLDTQFLQGLSEKLDDNAKEKMRDEYLNNKSKHLVCNTFDGLFEGEFRGGKMLPCQVIVMMIKEEILLIKMM